MKITIVCAGKIKEKYLRDGIAEYEKRLRPYADVRTHEIAEERMKEKPSAAEKAETIRREGERLLAQVPQGAYLIVLDVGGAELSSEELAAKIDRLAVTGESSSGDPLVLRMSCVGAPICGFHSRILRCRIS